MNREAVQSSNIASIGWSNGTMEIEFRNGSVYSYPDTPKQDYEDLKSAGSIGSHFHRHIRHRNNSRV